MRICIVYDCLFPYTVGGAERWYRNLAERLAADGHEVTYLTLRQWDRGEPPRDPRACASSPSARGWRSTRRGGQPPRSLPPLRLRPRRALATCCATARATTSCTPRPSPTSRCSPPGCRAPLRRYRLVVDWHEVWTRDYWREYLGARRRRGRLRGPARSACACRQRAFCFSPPARATACARRACAATCTCSRASTRVARRRPSPRPPSPLVVFAGPPHPGEARARRAAARSRVARERDRRSCAASSSATARSARRCERAIATPALGGIVDAPGLRRPREEVERALRARACLVLPSRREGYGLVVVEAASRGHAERRRRAARTTRRSSWSRTASTASSPRRPRPRTSAAAIAARRTQAGAALRASTARWFAAQRASGCRSTASLERRRWRPTALRQRALVGSPRSARRSAPT